MLGYLRCGNISPAFYVPGEHEIALIRERLMSTPVDHRCGCGEPQCATYYLRYPKKTHNVALRTIRFFARGEAMLHLDNEGHIFKIERLREESCVGAAP